MELGTSLLLAVLNIALLLKAWHILSRIGRPTARRPPSIAAPPARDASRAARVTCISGLREVAREESGRARAAWSGVEWENIQLRVGPDYRKHRLKRPTTQPLLDCVGVDVFRVDQKITTNLSSSLERHAEYLPREVIAAARGGDPTALPSFFVVSVAMPGYSGPQPDGPGLKILFYLTTPPSLSARADPAAVLLREFLDGAASGHMKRGCKFYDRFKVIGRVLQMDGQPGLLLRSMLSKFNGTPMLWRFFGIWGNCGRAGGVAYVNLDFCTGGRLKNTAFAQGLPAFKWAIFDMSWTIESRDNSEMPEVLLGGAAVCRPDARTATRLVWSQADGRYRIQQDSADPNSLDPNSRAWIPTRARRCSAPGGVSLAPVAALLVGILAACGLVLYGAKPV